MALNVMPAWATDGIATKTPETTKKIPAYSQPRRRRVMTFTSLRALGHSRGRRGQSRALNTTPAWATDGIATKTPETTKKIPAYSQPRRRRVMTFTSLLRHRAIDDDSSRPRHQTGDHIDLVAPLCGAVRGGAGPAAIGRTGTCEV